MKSDAQRNPEDRTRRTTQSEVEIVAKEDGILCLKRRTPQSEVEIVVEKDGRSRLKIRTILRNKNF